MNLLNERVEMLKTLNQWAVGMGPASRSSRGPFYVLERFHLNHRAAFNESEEITQNENELVRLKATTVFLTISAEVVKERIMSRNPSQWINKSEEEIKDECQGFIKTQNNLRKQSLISKVPTVEVNTDSKNWKEIATHILKEIS